MAKMKRFVVDGHNLIPKIPGIRLEDLEDENRLIDILNEFCRLGRAQVEVFFDGAPNPAAPKKKSGLTHAHFIRKGLSADDAIIDYVRNQQKPNFQLTVVSSDHRVQFSVKTTGAITMTSEAFAAEMQRVFTSPTALQEQKEKQLSPREVALWLDEFEKTIKTK
jgi:predicted RNA-binding protein with PIN domain